MKNTFLCIVALASCFSVEAAAQTTTRITLRGQPQKLELYGPRDGDPVIVTSGDGGWIHLAPQIASVLAARGFSVIGFDAKAYLEAFTTAATTLSVADVPGDYRELVKLAGSHSTRKPILIGVSEGAALSLLAATDPAIKAIVGGVIGLGLGDRNELGWRWKDAVIYLTHGVPHEPTFSTRDLAGRVAPTPLSIINSTHDEFVSADEVSHIIAAAAEPKRLFMIDAADHRFSNKQAELTTRLLEAINWTRQTGAK